MSGRPAGWWAWHGIGAVAGIALAYAFTRDPWVAALTAAAALGWSVARHRLAPWLGALMIVLYGVVFSAAWFVLHRAGGR